MPSLKASNFSTALEDSDSRGNRQQLDPSGVPTSELEASIISSHWDPKDLKIRDSIFLSHSGADKAFVLELFNDLRENGYAASAFVDQESLPKAAIVTMKNILGVARECQLAVFILSEEFFLRNKNPMLELAACIDSKKKLLPLFYKLSVQQYKEKERRQKWFEEWNRWEQKESAGPSSSTQLLVDGDLKVNLSKWKNALKIIGDTNGEEFRRSNQSERSYREVVVRRISKLVIPDIRWDDSGVHGKRRLCQVVEDAFSREFSDAAPTNERILGIYGMGGTGKTFLCPALLNFYSNPEFEMKVCHIELDSGRSQSKAEELQRIQKILKALTNASTELVKGAVDVEQGRFLLRKHICDNTVFLVVDNVGLESIEEASSYLEKGFAKGSKIIVLGRSEEILKKVLRKHIVKSRLLSMPPLLEEEAIQLFEEKLGDVENEQMNVISDCVRLCHFEDSANVNSYYHPLLLIQLAALLEETRPSEWSNNVKRWQSRGTSAVPTSVLECLQIGYDELTKGEKQSFLDIALFAPSKSREVSEWLSVVNGEEEDLSQRKIGVLKRRAFLTGDKQGYFKVHALHREMAIRLVDEAAMDSNYLVRDSSKFNQELLDVVTSGRKIVRVAITGCEFGKSASTVDLSALRGLEVLKLSGNRGLRKVTLRGNRFLKSLEVESDSQVAIRGLSNCSSLGWISLENCDVKLERLHRRSAGTAGRSCFNEIIFPSPLPRGLRWVRLKGSEAGRLISALKLACMELERLVLINMQVAPATSRQFCLTNHSTLKQLILEGCKGLKVVSLGSSLSSLEELRLENLTDLVVIDGLGDLQTSLRIVRITSCDRLQRIGNDIDHKLLPGGLRLERLDLKHCQNLVSFHGLGCIKSLKNLYLGQCNKLLTPALNTILTESPLLETLDLDFHQNLTPDISKLTALQDVFLEGFADIATLRQFVNLPNLERFQFWKLTIRPTELLQLLITRDLPLHIRVEVIQRIKNSGEEDAKEICRLLIGTQAQALDLLLALLTKQEPSACWAERDDICLFLYRLLGLEHEINVRQLLFHIWCEKETLPVLLEHEQILPSLWLLPSLHYAHLQLRVPLQPYAVHIANTLTLVALNSTSLHERMGLPCRTLQEFSIDYPDVVHVMFTFSKDENVMQEMKKQPNNYQWAEQRLLQCFNHRVH